MATATGWTFEVIDELNLEDVKAFSVYWNSSPPTHVSLANIHRLLEMLVTGEVSLPPEPLRAGQPPLPAASNQGTVEDLIKLFGTDGVLRA